MQQPRLPDFIRKSKHRDNDDLLTAGLGFVGLQDPHKPGFDNLDRPTPNELRRRAIHTSWRSIADFNPSGGLGSIYGLLAPIPGREFHAFMHLEKPDNSHRVLLQAPDNFDRKKRCLILTASPGSQGIYGGIALAGAWGLPKGCAVVYTDKGAGSGYFDTTDGSGVGLDGTRANLGDSELEFSPSNFSRDDGIGIKHAHSGCNPESHWGEYLLQAVDFAMAMLDEAYPDAAPFTTENTRIIATGISNGAGAVLQAAGLDTEGILDGIVAISPNIFVPYDNGRAFYDYACEAALFMSGIFGHPQFEKTVQGRYGRNIPDHAAWTDHLAEAGLLNYGKPRERAAETLEYLRDVGWSTEVLSTAILTSDLEIWRAAGTTYASSYLRRPLGLLPCNEAFRALALDAEGKLLPLDTISRATWWSDAPGIAPGVGILPETLIRGQPLIESLLCLYNLSKDEGKDSNNLRIGINETSAKLPPHDIPLWVLHGEQDGLIPPAFSSYPYIDWLREHNRNPVLWRLPHVQHFDALLGSSTLAAYYLPMLPYAYAALDALWKQLEGDQMNSLLSAAGNTYRLDSKPRGNSPLTSEHLGLN